MEISSLLSAKVTALVTNIETTQQKDAHTFVPRAALPTIQHGIAFNSAPKDTMAKRLITPAKELVQLGILPNTGLVYVGLSA
jgi:hypothetical protein